MVKVCFVAPLVSSAFVDFLSFESLLSLVSRDISDSMEEAGTGVDPSAFKIILSCELPSAGGRCFGGRPRLRLGLVGSSLVSFVCGSTSAAGTGPNFSASLCSGVSAIRVVGASSAGEDFDPESLLGLSGFDSAMASSSGSVTSVAGDFLCSPNSPSFGSDNLAASVELSGFTDDVSVVTSGGELDSELATSGCSEAFCSGSVSLGESVAASSIVRFSSDGKDCTAACDGETLGTFGSTGVDSSIGTAAFGSAWVFSGVSGTFVSDAGASCVAFAGNSLIGFGSASTSIGCGTFDSVGDFGNSNPAVDVSACSISIGSAATSAGVDSMASCFPKSTEGTSSFCGADSTDSSFFSGISLGGSVSFGRGSGNDLVGAGTVPMMSGILPDVNGATSCGFSEISSFSVGFSSTDGIAAARETLFSCFAASEDTGVSSDSI
mmetsp:Transcript_17966/g.34228  ORF Transcript_17966/g.34228 Transcript_17966/m.34228 type:complete len:436 (-) Transcript_17966:339-1646(-)